MSSRHPQYILSVVIEEFPLPFREHAHIHLSVRLDPHLQQRRPIRHRRDDQVAAVLERDEAFVEEVIDRRRQQQSVLAVEALFIGAVAPRFGMARDQVLQPLHLRHATGALDALHIGAKLPLPDARQDDGFALGVGDLRVFTDVVFDALLPSLEVRLTRWAQELRAINLLRDVLHLIRLTTDETEQRRRERPADFGQVHALQAIAIRAQRRVLLRQQAAQLADVALGVDAVRQLAKARVDFPAYRLPVAAGRAELRRLRALVAIGARDAERGDARVPEGEDNVARRDLAHGLAERLG
jgi:hypothetical protein